MRIRGSAKLSPALATANGTCPAELLHAHVCRLSQSPWDIAIIAQSSSNSQREGRAFEDYSFTRNGSLGGDSIGAVESVTSSMMGIGEDDNGTETTIMPAKRRRRKKKKKTTTTKTTAESENIVMDNVVSENGNSIAAAINVARKNKKAAKQQSKGSDVNGVALCQKNDGKGWQCKRAAKEGCNFCEHHLSLFRSYNNSNSTTANYNTSLGNGTVSTKHKSSAAPAAPAEDTAVGRRTRGAAAGKRPNPANLEPEDFYYYSGFGPRWGRKRGGGRGRFPEAGAGGEDDGDEGSKLSDGGGADSSPSSSSTTTAVDGGGEVPGSRILDYVEYEDEDEDDDDEDSAGGGGGRKRVRRPVKARSLKSLM